jgi:hypothetical protein
MTQILLVEIPAGIDGAGTEKILRVASPPGYSHPSAPGYYAPRLLQLANARRGIVAIGRNFGQTSQSFSEITVGNIDGAFDEWLNYGYGRAPKILLGDSESAYSAFTELTTGRIEQATPRGDKMIFRLRDARQALEKEISPVVYAGTNSGITGLEGLDDDIGGQNKLRIFGAPKNITPDPVNSSDQIMGLNHDAAGDSAAVQAIDAVRVNGSPWSADTAYSTLVALQGGTVAQGDYDTALPLGLFRMGGNIVGAVTCDVTQGSSVKLADVAEALMLDAGVASGDLSAADLTALASDAPWDVGMVVRGETYRQVMDKLMLSAGGWYAQDRLGVYRFQQIKAPSGTPAATFKPFEYPNIAGPDDYAIKSIEPLASNDAGRGVPARKITVNYQKYWTQQNPDSLASGLSESEKLRMAKEYLQVTASDDAVLNQYPDAPVLEFDTYLTVKSHAQALADHLLSLLGVARQMFKLQARYSADLAEAIDLGDVVKVVHPRYGLDSGKLFNVHSIEYDARKKRVELELWG